MQQVIYMYSYIDLTLPLGVQQLMLHIQLVIYSLNASRRLTLAHGLAEVKHYIYIYSL